MPERTCLVTNTKTQTTDLLRLTVSGGRLVFDRGTKSPGRGVYVRRDSSALAKLPKLLRKAEHRLRAKGLTLPEGELDWAQENIDN